MIGNGVGKQVTHIMRELSADDGDGDENDTAFICFCVLVLVGDGLSRLEDKT